MIKKITTTILLILILTIPAAASFDPGKADFKLVYNDSLIQHEKFSVFVLPQEEINLKVSEADENDNYKIKHPEIKMIKKENTKWKLKSPEKIGNYQIEIYNTKTKDKILLQVFVMEAYDNLEDGYLNGYRIGDYPTIPDDKKEDYELPRGFIKVTKENENIYLSPHFQLKQFLCKQNSNYPKYLVIQPSLLQKLEYILREANKRGIRTDVFHVMSGYRTPYYNQAIGNVAFSRHIFGDAADIFIDRKSNNYMDDLNEDGRVNIADARKLSRVVEESTNRDEYSRFIGGLGIYHKTTSHGPFIHIDTRGYIARW
ncbi:MAG TPA: D-Ala-D-Ala carboxypeptidase family metallohydrolase [Halanaerobiales bacterium]|nr:D-Ala-D-Ala carboxypeptidase family metallohydrolase [Halanaerobiales bacterium]